MSDFTIFIDQNIPLGKEVFAGLGNIYIFEGRKLSNHDLKSKKNIILVSRSQTKINAGLLDGCNVLFCGTATSGTDHVDTEYLKQRNIPFAEAKGSNANSVAEFVIYSILKHSVMTGNDIRNSSIGVIGFGSIGKIVSGYASKLGLKVLINDPPLLDSGNIFPSDYKYAGLDEIFTSCNIVTNHVPLTGTGGYPTENLLSGDLISMMKANSLVIHASRGGVVYEPALKARLETGEIFASVDVWRGEPDFDTRLAELAILASPHVAGYSFDGKLNGTLMMAEAVENFFTIETNKNIIYSELEKSSRIRIESLSTGDLMQLLELNRQFEADTSKFKEIARKYSTERRVAFDNMRKYYPVSRETLK